MGLWYRVFGRNDVEVIPDAIRDRLVASGFNTTCDYETGASGWLRAELKFAATTPVHLERFRATEEGIRGELNSWAGFLETCDYEPKNTALMERVIQTKQLFTIRRPIDCANEALVERLCVDLCRFLASETDGIWQADDEGFFAADGTLLLREY
jgi:hypothetical protein